MHSIRVLADKADYTPHFLRENTDAHFVGAKLRCGDETLVCSLTCSCGLSYIGKISPANPIYLSFACDDVSFVLRSASRPLARSIARTLDRIALFAADWRRDSRDDARARRESRTFAR